MGGMVLVASGAGGMGGAYYVDRHLAPAIAADLSASLNRPVQLGDVIGVSPTRVRFGPSSIPATDTDRDTVEIEAIAVHFSLVELIRYGEMNLAVTLIRPQIYLDQDTAGHWLDTDIAPTDDSRLSVNRVRLRDATVVIEPMSAPFRFHPRAVAYRAEHADEFDGPLPHSLIGPGRSDPRWSNPDQSDLALSPDTVELHQLNASVHLDDQEQFLNFFLEAHGFQGGRLQTTGRVTLEGGRVEADIEANRVAIAPFSSLLSPALWVEDGVVSGQVHLVAQPESPIALSGQARLSNLTAWAEGEPNPFTQTGGTVRFEGQTIHIEQGQVRYGLIPFDVRGTIHLTDGLNLQAQVKSVSVPDFMKTFDLSLPFEATGTLQTHDLTVTGPFNHVVFAGTVSDGDPVALDRVNFAEVRTAFTLNKGTDVLTLIDTEFTPSVGGHIAGQARILLGDEDDAVITATSEGVPADAIAALYNLPLEGLAEPGLGQITASTQVVISEQDLQTELRWGLEGGAYPASGILSVADNRMQLRDMTARFGRDTLHATGELAGGRWQTTLRTDGFSLAAAVPNTPGQVEGTVALMGTIQDLSPAAVRARGELRLVDVSPILDDPVQIAFGWEGDRLQIQQAKANWVQASGWVDARFDGIQPDITAMSLKVQVPDLNLTDLPVDLPVDLPILIAGRTQFEGTVIGTPAAPQLTGRLRLHDLTAGAIAFDRTLEGRIQFSSDQQFQLALAGDRDQIGVAGTRQQIDFEVKRDRAVLQGQWADSRLQATLQDIPLDWLSQNDWLSQKPALNLEPQSGLASLTGRLSGRINLDHSDPENPDLRAEVAVAQPSLGPLPAVLEQRHRGDRFTGNLHYTDDTLTLTEGRLQFGASRLRLDGQMSGDRVTGQLRIGRGELEDVVTLVQSAPSDLNLPIPLSGFMPQRLETDMVTAWPIAASQQIQGQFEGRMAVQTGTQTEVQETVHANARIHSPPTLEATPDAASRANPESDSLQIALDLRGQDWRIGDVRIQRLRLSNVQFDGTHLSVPTVRLAGLTYGEFAAPDATFIAAIDTRNQTGQLELNHVPLALLGTVMHSPMAAGGKLRAIAHWQPSVTAPTLTGTLSLQNPSLGRLSTDAIHVGFSVRDDQMQIGQWRVPGNPVELIATGRIPLRLPFGTMTSEPNAVALMGHRAIAPLDRSERAHLDRSLSLGGADELVLAYGLFQPSFAVSDLEHFVETGDLPNGWEIYLSLADINQDDLRALLAREIPLNLATVDHLMNSPVGEQILDAVGQVIHTPSRQANVQAIRSAFVLAVQDDGRVSILDFLNHYPNSKVYVDLSRLGTVMNALEAPESHD